MEVYINYYGVYSPKDELEAVEDSLARALQTARNLSPKIDGRVHLNRTTIEPVFVVRGSFDEFLREAHLRRGSEPLPKPKPPHKDVT